jgi:hypothetical protein
MTLVFDGEIPGLLDEKFLLREQIIGEVRGQRWLIRRVNSEITKLTEQIKEPNAKRTDTEAVEES